MERALAKGDWKEVYALCGSDRDSNPSPVVRAIAGHACLATNRNNSALVLFLSVDNDTSSRAWLEWTSGFAARNPGNPVAAYLRGDALARCGMLDSALGVLGAAVQAAPRLALAWNALGTIRASRHEWKEARTCLEKACAADDRLADAQASFGTMLVLDRAPEGALEHYGQAAALSADTDFVLARNGRGCANYGLVKWEEANEDFASAARAMPVALPVANIRALAVAAENSQLPEMKNSPLFRVTDFLDWKTLSDSSKREGSVIRIALDGTPLPETVDLDAIKRLNRALGMPGFYSKVEGRLDVSKAPPALPALLDETKTYRDRGPAALTAEQKERIQRLNRMLLELAYPLLIAQHNQRDPGTQLTLKYGLIDKMTHRSMMSPGDIIMGQARMDNLWIPMWHAVTKIPVIGFIGKWGLDHCETSHRANSFALKDKWGMDLERTRVGGVLVDLRRAYVDKGDWPVGNWFGLAYVSH
jgi:tetratricopeptide (TPR) repeat protein